MRHLAKLAAISAGAAIGILTLGAAINMGFAIGAWKLSLDEE